MKTIVLIFLFFCGNQIVAQTEIEQESENSIQQELYTKCFENLKPVAELHQYVSVKKIKLCSLIECRWVAEYFKDDKSVQSIVFNRATEIVALLHRERHHVYLINGLDSYDRAQKENMNMGDNNGMVYISVGDCLSSDILSRFMEIVNEETQRLLNK